MDQFYNFDEVFIRSVVVGLVGASYDKIRIFQIKDDKRLEYTVPIFYSDTGSEQFNNDFYLNFDAFNLCEELDARIEGNIRKIPSGVLLLEGANIESSNIGNRHERITYSKIISGEFGNETRKFSAKGRLIPLVFQFECKIRCSSDVMRMKVFQSLIRTFHKNFRFYINFEGFYKLPCDASFPENYSMSKNFQFSSGQEINRPELVFSLEVRAPMPDTDITTELHTEEKMSGGINVAKEILNK